MIDCGRPQAAPTDYFLIGKFRVIVHTVSISQPALEPAQKILALAAGLDAHLAQAPDLAPAGAGDNQLEGLAAADVDELQRPLLNLFPELVGEGLVPFDRSEERRVGKECRL